MLVVVGKHRGLVLQKITTPTGKKWYQIVPEGITDASKVIRCDTLNEAQMRMGLVPSVFTAGVKRKAVRP